MSKRIDALEGLIDPLAALAAESTDEEADVNDAQPEPVVASEPEPIAVAEPEPVGLVPNVILEHQQIAGEKHWPVYVETFHSGDRRPPTLTVDGVGYCASRVDPESGLWIYRSM